MAVLQTGVNIGTLMAGAAYEVMNIAALYSLPVIFFLENNLYAVSTHVREQTRETRLSSRGPMLAIPAIEVDGMELLAVRRAMQEARRMIVLPNAGRAGDEFVRGNAHVSLEVVHLQLTEMFVESRV